MINPTGIDFLIRVKNAYMAGKKELSLPSSKFCVNLCEILKKHRFIGDYLVSGDVKKTLTVKLSYLGNKPAVSRIDLFSTPGRRLYQKSFSLPWGKSKSSLIIISTSSGLLSQRQASSKNLGGEILAEIY